MKIKKILNNNLVIASDRDNEEVVVWSKGLGFRKKKGDFFQKEEAEKIFVLQDEDVKDQYSQLMEDADPRSVEIAEAIISNAADEHHMQFNESVHLALTDHINSIISRLEEGVNLTNQLTMEISKLYPDEFKIGIYGNDLIEQKTGYKPLYDEAAFIAMHLVNGQSDGTVDEATVRKTAEFISDVTSMIESYYDIELDETSYSYYRFVMHLKYLSKRIMQGMVPPDDPVLYDLVTRFYPESIKGMEKIAHVINLKYHKEVSTEEKAYIAIYVARLLKDFQDSQTKV